MSGRPKGDTSSSSPSVVPAPSRIVKNPLLSASVTGLTFDDFPNKPLLLPAAPPVIPARAPALSPPPIQSAGILIRESKSLVTVGQASDIDNDNLSEINLNSSTDETQSEISDDKNSNPLLEQTTNTDSLLSQAASSFSALPSVASTVFSTFSKRIYSASSSRECTPAADDKDGNANSIGHLDIQPSYIKQRQEQPIQPPQSLFTATETSIPSATSTPTSVTSSESYFASAPPPLTATGPPPSSVSPSAFQTQPLCSSPPPEPPKFYSPSEVPTIRANSSPSTGVQNNFRLSAKKKTYAPIPGFSNPSNVQSSQPAFQPPGIPAPNPKPIKFQKHSTPHGYPAATSNIQSQAPSQPNSEERKSAGGLFSIGNLVPTGVLQNISGLVQSATDTIVQTVKQDTVESGQYPPQQYSPLLQQQQSPTALNLGANISGTPTGPSLPPPPSFHVARPGQSTTKHFTLSSPDTYSTAVSQDVVASIPQSYFQPTDSQKTPLPPQESPRQLTKDIQVPNLKTTGTPNLESNQAISNSVTVPLLQATNVQPILTSSTSSVPLLEATNVQPLLITNTSPVPLLQASTVQPVPTSNESGVPLFHSEKVQLVATSNSNTVPLFPSANVQPVATYSTIPLLHSTNVQPLLITNTSPVPFLQASTVQPVPTSNESGVPLFHSEKVQLVATSNSNTLPFLTSANVQPVATYSTTPLLHSTNVQPLSTSNTNTIPPFQSRKPQTTPKSDISAVPLYQPTNFQPTPKSNTNTVPLFKPPNVQPVPNFNTAVVTSLQPIPTSNTNTNTVPLFQPIPTSNTSTVPLFQPANLQPIQISQTTTLGSPLQQLPVGSHLQYFDPNRSSYQPELSQRTFNVSIPAQIPVQPTSTAVRSKLYLPTPRNTTSCSLKPPEATSGDQTNYRLKKGTRLYKSTLTSVEPSSPYGNKTSGHAFPGQSSLNHPSSGHYPIFPSSNQPYKFDTSNTSSSVQQSPALFIPEATSFTNPAFFANESRPTVERHSQNSLGFFNPTTTAQLFQPKSVKDLQSIEDRNPGNKQDLVYSIGSPQYSDLVEEGLKLSGDKIQSNTYAESTSESVLKDSGNIEHKESVDPSPLRTKEEPFFNAADQVIEAVYTDSEDDLTSRLSETLLNFNIADQVIEPVYTESEDDLISQPSETFLKCTKAEQNIEAVYTATKNNTVSHPFQASFKEETDALDETLQKLLLDQETYPSVRNETIAQVAANFLPPPPQASSSSPGISNPYRREIPSATPASTTNTISGSNTQVNPTSFFTPAQSDFRASGDFNFFATTSTTTTEAPITSTSTDLDTPTTSAEGSRRHQFALTAPTENLLPSVSVYSSVSASSPGSTKDSVGPSPVHMPIAPPLGFGNISQDNLNKSDTSSSSLPFRGVEQFSSPIRTGEDLAIQQKSSDISVTNFFSTQNFSNPTPSVAQEPQQNLPPPASSFDKFASSSAQTAGSIERIYLNSDSVVAESTPTIASAKNLTKQQSSEDQRIQNFFNNPPPQDLGELGVGDLNYDFVHAGLAVKCYQTRSLTPISNIVEPPSSTCSEFSDLNSCSSLFQRQNFSTENSLKISPEEDHEETSLNTNKESLEKKSEDQIKCCVDLPEEILADLKMQHSSATTSASYVPAVKHWFYKRMVGLKVKWEPFSHYDSALLEMNVTLIDGSSNFVAVEGGRYEVNIRERTKSPVYWEGQPIEVRRCSWFFKGNDSHYIPYEEETAEFLEQEYKQAFESGEWHKKVVVPVGGQMVLHGPAVMVHFQQQQNADSWGGSSQTATRPRVVKRDLDEFTIESGEPQRVDHLLFVVHGIGAACDLKFRSVEEVVDDFRSIAQQLVSAHYKNSMEMGLVGRVEILPISWHGHLHSAEMGIDEKLKSITLESIPKLRSFTNDTLLDVLFYTNPIYCQKIMNTVASSMNTLYCKYRQRHPDFNGGVSVAGHSLGSLILFDLLCHQKPIKESEENNAEKPSADVDLNLTAAGNDNMLSLQTSYTMGPAGAGQPFINYVQLSFQPKKFFALGSPIGVFVTIRGIDALGLDFRFPTCSGFYNIFHPFDPVAYRIEALVNPDMSVIPPVLIPHHKGRKRMHLELKETMARVGTDLKQRFFDTFRNTLETVNFLGPTSSKGNKEKEAKELMEKEVSKVLQMQMELEEQDQQLQPQPSTSKRTRTDSISTSASDNDMVEIDFPLGKLNDSKRIDYVLQEAPLEFFNEYLFALSSHVCYWESEDTILFVMKEIYSGLGISADSQVPQQSLTIERPTGGRSVAGGTTTTTET